MKWLDTILVLVTAFLAAFGEAAFQGIRHLVGAQIDLLPALVVYASLSAGLGTVVSLAVCGGLWFDSLSANPLGISVLPLLAVGVAIYAQRDLILRSQVFARLILGLAASMVVPVLTLILLLTTSHRPLLGWGTLWQLFVMTVGGSIATPVLFEIFSFLHRLLDPVPASEPSFRADREIRRGK